MTRFVALMIDILRKHKLIELNHYQWSGHTANRF